ncbi:serine hydrolase domain-containing protein [Streptomyces sp. NPDC029674]|uniref:serine hydrolase domain-containing protein n=1 Tax=Streptomyces sp. NPDC029674 TaxID=3365297 RepID=UPI00384B97D7
MAAASRRRTGAAAWAVAVAATVAMAVTAGGAAAPASAATHRADRTDGAGGTHRTDTADTADTADKGSHRATRRAMEAGLNDDVVGVTARAVDRHGPWNAAAGIGDLERGTPRGAHDHYRVGSITKTFVATVLLQLEAEGELSLDDTVGRWLPGVVEGNGHDGDRITVRQLLNHTSGIFNISDDPEFRQKVFTEDFLRHRYDTWTAGQQVAMAVRHEPDFAPGTAWKYSNTNYVVAGLIIEKVTGAPYAQEIRRRVIEPLGLRDTTLPGTDPTVPHPSSRAYTRLSDAPGAKNHDVTEMNPSVGGAAGEMISDSADLTRFYSALLRGKLLPKRQLAAMKTTVPKGADRPGQRYGLGLEPFRTDCGTVVWGHGGDMHGSSSAAGATADGRHALALNFNGPTDAGAAVLNAEFCGKDQLRGKNW